MLRKGIVAQVAGAGLALLDYGHENPLERPRELAALIEAFLAGVGTTSSRSRDGGGRRLTINQAHRISPHVIIMRLSACSTQQASRGAD